MSRRLMCGRLLVYPALRCIFVSTMNHAHVASQRWERRARSWTAASAVVDAVNGVATVRRRHFQGCLTQNAPGIPIMIATVPRAPDIISASYVYLPKDYMSIQLCGDAVGSFWICSSGVDHNGSDVSAIFPRTIAVCILDRFDDCSLFFSLFPFFLKARKSTTWS